MANVETPEGEGRLGIWGLRLFVLFVALVGIACVALTNRWLTDRFTQDTRNAAELQLALNSENLRAELRQNQFIPQLLASDPALIEAIVAGDTVAARERLQSFAKVTNAASLEVRDVQGAVFAATGRVGQTAPISQDIQAIPLGEAKFSYSRLKAGQYGFYFTQNISLDDRPIGAVLVEVDLQKFETLWAGLTQAVMVAQEDGTIILSTEPVWRGKTEGDALAEEPAQSAISRALRVTTDWGTLPADAYLQGEAVMRLSQSIEFEGWEIISFTTYEPIRARVNSVLALVIMGFALVLALGFYLVSRRSALRLALFVRESAELRELNTQLQQEIAERKRVQENLAVAEQTLEQSSKLAALGEMSAAVSHELNQPLAAMKTYLAGARLLLRRNRTDEALAAFGRLDDLIERMGTITRQLKSYARKGEHDQKAVDVKDALSSSLTMMEPQLRQRYVQITRNLPRDEVLVMGNKVRLEQVIINLLRNALDATKSEESPRIDIILALGDIVSLTIRDNGPGIEDKNALFEPFYTTKPSGDGVGLGLAISSSIVAEMGGRLTARNGQAGGAVFEMELPVLNEINHNKQQKAGQLAAAE